MRKQAWLPILPHTSDRPEPQRSSPTRTYRSLAWPREQAGSLARRGAPGGDTAAAASACSRACSSRAQESLRRTACARGGRPSCAARPSSCAACRAWPCCFNELSCGIVQQRTHSSTRLAVQIRLITQSATFTDCRPSSAYPLLSRSAIPCKAARRASPQQPGRPIAVESCKLASLAACRGGVGEVGGARALRRVLLRPVVALVGGRARAAKVAHLRAPAYSLKYIILIKSALTTERALPRPRPAAPRYCISQKHCI